MTNVMGCEFCQHPSCWEYDVNKKWDNSASATLTNKQNINNVHNKPKDPGLPTYKIINFTLDDVLENDLEYFSDSSGSFCSDPEDYREPHKARHSGLSSLQSFPVGPSVSFDKGCLDRIRKRQKEVEEQEKYKLTDHAILNNHNVLKKQMVVLDKPLKEDQKMLVWFPGKNDQKEKHSDLSEKKEKTVSEFVIDGTSLPQRIDPNTKKNTKERLNKEPPALRAFRKLNHGYLDELLPVMIENGITLDEYLTLCRLTNMDCNQQMIDNRVNINIPSALKTTRMIPLPKTPTAIIREPHICKPASNQIDARPKHLSKSAVMYIKDGAVVASPIRQKKKRRRRTKKEILHRQQPKPRDALDMSYASIPKKAMKKYPIAEHHCKESIKMDKLASDVLIQPLSGSEASSICSLAIGDNKEQESRLDGVGKNQWEEIRSQPSVHMPHAPICKSRNSIPAEISRISQDESIIRHRLSRSSQSATRRISKEISTVHFQESAVIHSYDSRRVCTAPSLFSELVDLRKSFDEGDEQINRSFVAKSDSRAFSVLSEQSSHFSCTNKELIDQTYNQYESFTPFKTPLQSKHQMSRTGTMQSQRGSLDVIQPSQLLVISPSLHTMGNILSQEASVRQRNSSSIHRSISPTRNYSRHQKGTTSNNDITPSEMKISKVQLQPARSKSPITKPKHESSQDMVYNNLHHYHVNDSAQRIEPMPSRESQSVPPPTPVTKTSVTSNNSSVPPSIQLSPNDSVDSVILKNIDGTQQDVIFQFYNKPGKGDTRDDTKDGETTSDGNDVIADNEEPPENSNIIEDSSVSEEQQHEQPVEATEDLMETDVLEEMDNSQNENVSSPESVHESNVNVLVSMASAVDHQEDSENKPVDEAVSPASKTTSSLDENQNIGDVKNVVQNQEESSPNLLAVQSTNSLDTKIVSTIGCLSPSECKIKIPDIETKLSDMTLSGLTSSVKTENLIDGLSLDLNLNEDILKALDNIDDFVEDLSDEEDE